MKLTSRIDELPNKSFTSIDELLAIQNEAISIIDKFYLLKSSQITDMEEKFRTLHSTILYNPELYKIVKNTFIESTKFQNWRKTLSAEKQAFFTLGLENDPVTGMYQVKMGTGIQFREPIPLGDREDGYETKDYIQLAQSRWLKQFLETELDEHKLETANQLETFIRDERTCALKANNLRGLLNQYLNDSRLRFDDRKNIDTCLTLLDKYQEAYKEIKLHDILSPDNQSLDEVISRFNKRYQSQAYVKYHHAMENFIPQITMLSELGKKYPNLPSSAALLNAANILVSRPEQTVRLLTSASALNQALPLAENRLASFNAIKQVNLILQNKPSSREAALNAILSFESLEITSPEKTEQALHYKSAYLEKLLTEAYPDFFSKSDGIFKIKHSALSSELVYKALGLIKDNVLTDLKNATVLNPEQFNLKELNNLAVKDNSSPLWQILIMIKPVDKSFTIHEKIDACVGVIDQINTKKLTLNNNAPLEQTTLLAPYLLNLINSPVDKTFTPENKIATLVNVIKLIKTSKLKLNNQPTIKQMESIAKSALNITESHDLRNPETAQLLTEIRKEIKQSMFFNQLSIRQEMKDYLEGNRGRTSSKNSDTDSAPDSEDEEHKSPPPKPPKPR